MASFERDPLSVFYDGYVRQVMLRAIRASRNERGVAVWIASPRRDPVDPRGLTAHERAFQRSCYYLMWRVYLNRELVPPYALKMTWTDETRPSSSGRSARRVNIRLFLRSKARPRGKRWTDDPAQQSRVVEGRRVVPAP